MASTDKEIVEKYRERIKRQAETAKQNFDCISVKLPKGTKERIRAQGFTVNAFINALVVQELERLEKK